jgi:hypothetical protein
MLKTVRQIFDLLAQEKESREKVDENPKGRIRKISTTDAIMSGLAVFHLKYPSLLRFDQHRAEDPAIENNLKNLFGIQNVPSDTYMRERLDGLDVSWTQKAINFLFHRLQRGKALEKWKVLDKYYVVSVDGTGSFYSSQISCKSCCTTVHNRGKENEYTTYDHKMIVGSIVHPDIPQVLPILFEPNIKEDGDTKNDCERSGIKRFLKNFHKIHPFLPVIFVADGLHSNGPLIKEIVENKKHYIITAKEADHQALYEYFWTGEHPDVTEFTDISHGITGTYRFMDNVPLNDSHLDLLVTVIHLKETDEKGKTTNWCWVTNLKVSAKNIKKVVKVARSRFKIENETYNTLKNFGYGFGRNFGHGSKTLCNFLASLMILAFLIDQILESFNKEFRACLEKCVSHINLWERIRSFFFNFVIPSWEVLYAAILDPPYPILKPRSGDAMATQKQK